MSGPPPPHGSLFHVTGGGSEEEGVVLHPRMGTRAAVTAMPLGGGEARQDPGCRRGPWLPPYPSEEGEARQDPGAARVVPRALVSPGHWVSS